MKTVQLPKKFLNAYPDCQQSVKLLRYVRNDVNAPVGVVLIDVHDNVGIYMLNTHMGDRWDVVKGIRRALYRTRHQKKLVDAVRAIKVTPDIPTVYRTNIGYLLQTLSFVIDRINRTGGPCENI